MAMAEDDALMLKMDEMEASKRQRWSEHTVHTACSRGVLEWGPFIH
jgi:hypothetical protein